MRNYDVSQIPSPCYVLEEKLLIKNLRILNRVEQEAGVSILCALKGYAFWKSFSLLKQYVTGATASSLFEAKLISEEWGVKAHLCCPVYVPKDFDEITSISSFITFNSFSQYELYKKRALVKGLSIGLRVNPLYAEIETELYNPASEDSRLGIRKEHINEWPIDVEGLHVHVLCENGADVLVRMLAALEDQFSAELHQVKWVNLGGGHHITKDDYNVELLIRTLILFREKYDVKVFLEPGEAFGWQTGFLKSTVLDIVEGENVKTAILDVSFTAHMPDCLEMPYKPEVVTDAVGPLKMYRLGGVSCLAGDFVGNYELPELQIRDTVLFEDMMHYTMVKTTMFNGVNLPSIGVVGQDEKFELINSYGFCDYKSRLS